MRQITSPENVRELPLDDPLLARLYQELVELPFGGLYDAKMFWQQEGTRLWLLEQDDDVDLLLDADQCLGQILDCPEYVISLDDRWHLALAITTDSGGGCYLLFPVGIDNRLDRLIDLT